MRIVRGLYRVMIDGFEVPYLINPSREEMLRFMEKVWDPVALGASVGVDPFEAEEDEKHLKGVLVTKPETLYVFDPMYVHHWDFIQKMGISDSPESQPYVVSLMLSKDEVIIDIYNHDYSIGFNFKNNLEAPVKKSKFLKRIYGPGFKPKTEFH